ncbi:MAG: DUF1844 domain-containing protein [Acidobacteriota bacterium]|nr:DUF1844 domain-containing protein [Acidobacteriota bacterium]
MAENKPEEAFRVIDRRPFTSEGEIRKDVVEAEERKAEREAAIEAARKPAAPAAPEGQVAAPVAADAPKASPAFQNLVQMIGSNAAMVLGAYADPRTGQPVIDPEAARELIDMLDVLHEKTRGHLAPEEETLLVDLLGKLKMTFLEVNQALAAQAAKVAQQAKVGAKR